MTEYPAPTPEEDPWLTVQQVSEELKLHPATVRSWVKHGRLAAVRAGRTWRVRRSEVERALMSDASPAYARDEGSSSASSTETPNGSVRTSAPRQIADHIMTVGPQPGGRS
jgi:excisionase family DNA binding protein